MSLKVTTVLFLMVFVVMINANILNVSKNNTVSDIDKFKNHIDQFKSCVDQYLAGVAGDVNEGPLKPVFSVIGDQVGRLSKAWDDLTRPTPNPETDY